VEIRFVCPVTMPVTCVHHVSTLNGRVPLRLRNAFVYPTRPRPCRDRVYSRVRDHVKLDDESKTVVSCLCSRGRRAYDTHSVIGLSLWGVHVCSWCFTHGCSGSADLGCECANWL
jgi:hypothetical protein